MYSPTSVVLAYVVPAYEVLAHVLLHLCSPCLCSPPTLTDRQTFTHTIHMACIWGSRFYAGPSQKYQEETVWLGLCRQTDTQTDRLRKVLLLFILDWENKIIRILSIIIYAWEEYRIIHYFFCPMFDCEGFMQTQQLCAHRMTVTLI